MNATPSKKIGGFFPLEPLHLISAQTYHTDALPLTSGRACLSSILELAQAQKIYLPYYICDAVPLTIQQYSLEFEFYEIDATFAPKRDITLRQDEMFLYVNYFGVTGKIVEDLYAKYSKQLIIDNTQNFFDKKARHCWSFNSARKFFGVPDGGYLYSVKPEFTYRKRNEAVDCAHLIARANEHPHAYLLFQLHEEKISSDILGISLCSEKILKHIDYMSVMERRKQNWAVYADIFSSMNKLSFKVTETDVPFCYPLWIDKPISRQESANLGLFIPMFWQDVLNRNENSYLFEKKISLELLPLPLDHRYSQQDCERVAETILLLA